MDSHMEEKTNDSGSESLSTFDFEDSKCDGLTASTTFSDSCASCDEYGNTVAKIHILNVTTANAAKQHSLEGERKYSTQQQRSVRFNDDEVTLEQEKNALIESDPSCSAGDDLVQVLRERLLFLQTDLDAEKSLRKRKEKNLVKLAKELNKRAAVATEKESKIHEMAATINSLESKLKNIQRDSAQEVQTYLTAFRGTEIRITELDGVISDLRKQLLDANVEIDCFHSKLLSAEQAMVDTSVHQSNVLYSKESTNETVDNLKSSHSKSWISWSSVIGTLVSILMSVALQNNSLPTIDVLCAPVVPGTVLFSDSGSFEAPWWVPLNASKGTVFNAVCGNRPRTKLSWIGKKLFVHKLSNEKTGFHSIVWQGRVPLGAMMSSNSISVITKKGTNLYKAPWSV